MKFFSTLLLSLVLDQASKAIASQYVTLQYNSGVSLSWLIGSNQFVLTGVLFIFLLAIGWLWRRVWQRFPLWSGLFFGAAVSNLLDRMLYSGVRDWLTLPGLQLKNNVADWLVCLSLAFILMSIIKEKNGKYAD